MINDISALEFASPWWLLLLLLLPLWWLLARSRTPAAIVFSRVAVLARGPRAGRGLARFLTLLRNLALVSGVVALARPRAGAHAVTSTSEGINIVIAFDISSSMLAEDFQPQNRLEVARETASNSSCGCAQSDRIGIVAFSGEALTQVPLTTDYPVVHGGGRQPAARPARGRHGDRDRDRHGGQPPARRTRQARR